MEQLLQHLLESSLHQKSVTQELAKGLQAATEELLDLKKSRVVVRSIARAPELLDERQAVGLKSARTIVQGSQPPWEPPPILSQAFGKRNYIASSPGGGTSQTSYPAVHVHIRSLEAGDHCYFWSGPERRTGLYGVALAIPKDLRKSLISWTPMSNRLLSARFLHEHGKMTVIVAYAPTDVADEDAKDAFFDQLHQAVGLASPHGISIILTDTNATLSISERSTGSPVGTTFADRFTNDNGNRLLLLCHYNNLCVADTWFPQKLIHYWTWYSPDGRTRKASDHILISRRWKSVVTNCRVYRGAELGNTDHRLLVAHLKLKLRANQHTKTLPRLDSSLLSDPNIATDFSCAIHRTFDNLAKDKVNDWQTFKKSIIQSAHNVFGHFRPPPKKPWILQRTLNIIDR
ncbi:craniofacial development protein 2-like, partial, partial [Tachysurus ichikawai]